MKKILKKICLVILRLLYLTIIIASMPIHVVTWILGYGAPFLDEIIQIYEEIKAWLES